MSRQQIFYYLSLMFMLAFLFSCNEEDKPAIQSAQSKSVCTTTPVETAALVDEDTDESSLSSEEEKLELENEMRENSRELSDIKEKYKNEDSSRRGKVFQEMRSVVEHRSEILKKMIQVDPNIILRNNFAQRSRRDLPAEVQQCVETNIVKEGRLEVLSARSDVEHKLLYFLRDDAGIRYSLHFKNRRIHQKPGHRIRVSGVFVPCGKTSELSANPIALSSSEEVRQTNVAGLTKWNSLGQQKVLAFLLNFQDKGSTDTIADVEQVVFGDVNDFYVEASYGKTFLTGDAVGPYTISINSTSCDYSAIAGAAQAEAVANGVNLSNYDRYVYIFPQNNSCSWLGLGTVGSVPSEAWINGDLDLHTVAHELGHNLGLYHSNAFNCGSSSVKSSGCSNIEYGDKTDVMGNSRPGHFNAFQKEQLLWLGQDGTPKVTLVQSNGTYFIEPYETNTQNAKVLKILKSISPSGGKTYYYVEFRQRVGFDNSAFTSVFIANNLTQGVVIHKGTDNNMNSSYVLNMNPGQSWHNAALESGKTFFDPYSGVTVTLQSYSSLGASVKVDFVPVSSIVESGCSN